MISVVGRQSPTEYVFVELHVIGGWAAVTHRAFWFLSVGVASFFVF